MDDSSLEVEFSDSELVELNDSEESMGLEEESVELVESDSELVEL